MTIVAGMSIRNLDERVIELLRIRAAYSRSIEAEVRAILVDAARDPDDAPSLLDVLARFAELGGGRVATLVPVTADEGRLAQLPGLRRGKLRQPNPVHTCGIPLIICYLMAGYVVHAPHRNSWWEKHGPASRSNQLEGSVTSSATGS